MKGTQALFLLWNASSLLLRDCLSVMLSLQSRSLASQVSAHSSKHWGIGENPVPFENSESVNEERQGRHLSPLSFLLRGLKPGCCLCSWGEIYGAMWCVKKTPSNPNSPSASWEVIFFIFITVARSPWRVMDLRSQRIPVFVQRKGNWDEWMGPHDLSPSRSCVEVLPLNCWESMVPALDVSELLTFDIQPRYYKILCTGTALFPVIKGKPCDQRYVFKSLWLLLEKSTSDILTWVLNVYSLTFALPLVPTIF